ncbi:MAG: GNAT family N-acetyltransferase [Clostridia bacterium]|nr:GNAT family N-acetyltransferase [Clostridia bacterium]
MIITYAAGAFCEEGPGIGDGLEWSFDSATHTLSVTGSGKMKTLSEYRNTLTREYSAYYNSPWTKHAGEITKLYIGAGVEFFDTEYLSELTLLKQITVEEGSKTYVSEIGVLYGADKKELLFCPPQLTDDFEVPDEVRAIAKGAFAKSQIKSVVVPETVETIGEWAFIGSQIRSVDLRANIEVIPEYCFSSASMLVEIVSFPKNLKRIEEGAFARSALERIVLPEGLDTVAASAFIECRNCEELVLPLSLKTVGDDNFTNLAITQITIPGSVRKIGANCFSYCEKLESVKFEEGLKELGSGCFRACPLIKEAVLPESLEKLERHLFMECESLESVTVLNPDCECAAWEVKNGTLTLVDDTPIFSSGILIKGHTGSEIETYALLGGFAFESIGSPNDPFTEEDPEKDRSPSAGDSLKWVAPMFTLAMVSLLALAAFSFIREKAKKNYVLYWCLAFAGTIGAACYPLSMGAKVLSDMLKNGAVRAEDYPKYVIPYTPISMALILGVLFMPAAIRYLRKFALPVSGALSLGVFFGFEKLFETRFTVTSLTDEASKTLVESNLGDWQTYMCYAPLNGEASGYTGTSEKVADILSGNYDPAFRLHFYLISAVLILSVLTCLYGFGKAIKENKKNFSRLAILSVLTASFIGMCILACFTSFFRTGEIEVSALTAALMALFFVLLGSTAGVSFASLFRGKGKFLSVVVPTVLAGAVTLLMYIGEMILLKNQLYRFPGGFFFEGLPGIVLAPADIAVILLSAVLTLVFCLNTDRQKKTAKDRYEKLRWSRSERRAETLSEMLAAPEVRDARLSDAERLSEIYSHYVLNTAISFETEAPSPEKFRERMMRIMKRYPYKVVISGGIVAGYAYAGSFKDRAAYDRSCETTIYLDPLCTKLGLGRALYEALEKDLKKMGILNLYACVAYPETEDEYLTKNSAEFHSHLGYKTVGEFHKCGYKFSRWYDMIWMEKIIGDHATDRQQ